jgi:hypothetical protein
MKKSPDTSLNDETAMRAFYEMCGISQEVTEAAIKMRREHPVELEKEAFRIKYGRPQNKRNERSGA